MDYNLWPICHSILIYLGPKFRSDSNGKKNFIKVERKNAKSFPTYVYIETYHSVHEPPDVLARFINMQLELKRNPDIDYRLVEIAIQ